MNKWIIELVLLGFMMWGCKHQDNNNKTVNDEKNNSEHYINFDDELETKSVAAVDTVEFRNVMNTLLPTKKIIELFGSGYQIFYLGLTIEPDGKVSANLAPDAGWWVTGLGNVERLLFKDNLEIAKNYAIVPNPEGDSKAISIKEIFYFPRLNVQKAFKAAPGLLNGKKVQSVKLFQIDVTIDNVKNIIKPWSIKEVDITKFRPQINSNLGREHYMGYFPSVLKEDFKFISHRIEFPKEAVTRGVRGRVLINLYYESNGDYAGYQLIKGLGYGCDEAVVNAIKSLKPKCYPSGQRSTLLVPFNFGPSDKIPIDLSVQSFEYNPNVNYNPLKLIIVNNVRLEKVPTTKYSIYGFLDNELIFFDRAAVVPTSEYGTIYWFGGKSIKPGKHEYLISIDPENVLNDINRENNVLRGTLIVK